MRTVHSLSTSVVLAALLSAGCGGEGDDGGIDPNCAGDQCYVNSRFGLEYRPPSPYVIDQTEVVADNELIMVIVGEPMPGLLQIFVDSGGLGTHDMLYQLEEQGGHIRVVGSTPSTDGSSYWVGTGELEASNGHTYRFELSLNPGSPGFPSLFAELVAGVTLLD